ncbi:hypothetical protein F5050DRAFT_1796386 [Lentinula boryana]|uniref:Uncharacterized protein n=1 Tax=Lentinula boryana TaxID=40481 RepID=A0ABQ8QTG6_9AGAR|nr:hypothetical protein F5050DRAFT_1796386 [Lentinula boryana]
MNNLKRKRNQGDDSDDEELSFGRQILPVANLPDTFDGIPSDGMEYLFTVRRDARLLPHVARVPNPYQAKNPIIPPRSLETTHPSLPSPEWRSLFEIRFRNLRKNIAQPTDSTASSSKLRIPDLKNRSAWWDFLAGKPESVWNPPKKPKALKQKKFGRGMRAFNDDDVGLNYNVASIHEGDIVSQPAEGFLPVSPEQQGDKTISESSPLLCKPRMALHLLMYFTYWIDQHLTKDRQPPFPRLTRAHFQWVFTLLTRVDDYISADDMNLLRNLTRTCIALLKVIIYAGEDNADDQAACWMIISVVIGIWGQRDLWIDAEEMLKSIR